MYFQLMLPCFIRLPHGFALEIICFVDLERIICGGHMQKCVFERYNLFEICDYLLKIPLHFCWL